MPTRSANLAAATAAAQRTTAPSATVRATSQQARQPTWHISETFSAGQRQVILEDGVNKYTVASPEPGIAAFEKWEMAYVTDLAADGVDDAVVRHFTGGAHCCFEYLIFSQTPTGIHLDDWFSLGDATIETVRDLDGDSILEIETWDNRLAYFPDLSFAGSPFLPLVLCRSAQATYSDCTPHFPEKLQKSADDYERQLSDAVQRQVREEEKRGAALGLLASYLRLGKDDEGWGRVRSLCLECEDWLLLNFGELEQRLMWPQPSRAYEARISALGFTPIGTPVSTDDGSGGSLVALKGICVGSATGRCQQVFFFHNGEYLGTDMLSPSLGILDVQYAGVAKIAVTYVNYAPSDPGCCPSLAPVTITYSWDGTQLKASGVPPGH